MRRKISNAKKMANTKTSQAGPTTFTIPNEMSTLKIEGSVKKLDILPYITKTNPYVEPDCLHYERTFFVHRQVGADKRDYICPHRTLNQRCPICEYVRSLDDKDPQQRELLFSLLPKQRQLWLVIDLDDTDKGVQLWEYSYHLFGKILKSFLDADEDEKYIHFHDPADGYSMRVLFEEESIGNSSYKFWKAISIDFKKRKEPYADELIESLPCLDELLIVHPYDELEAIFQHAPDDEGPAEISGKTAVDADAPWVKGDDDGGFGEKKPDQVAAAAEKEFKDDDDWD